MPLLTVAAVFFGLTVWTWRKWSDVLIDFGNELYVPWRLVEGDVLYRDIAFAMGPASQYFNAFLFRIFGVSLTTLIFANLTVLAVITLLMFLIFRRLSGPVVAAGICVFFLSLFGFAQYVDVANYCYVCPYRHEMTHGILLCLAEIYCFARFLDTRRFWLFAMAGACCGGTAMTKVEFAVVTLALFLLALGLLSLAEKSKRPLVLKGAGIFSAGFASVVVVMLVLLCRNMPLADALRGSFANWFYAANSDLASNYPFFKRVTGLDDPWTHLLEMWTCLLIGFGILFGALLIDQRLPRPKKGLAGVSILVAAVTFAGTWFLLPLAVWISVAKVLPAVSLLAVVGFLWQAVLKRSSADEFKRYFLAALWSALSVLVLAKMLLNPQLRHYGFVLAMPASVLLVYLGIAFVPDVLGRSSKRGDLFRAVMLALTASWGLSYLGISYNSYQGKTLAVGAGGDVTFHNPHANFRNQAIASVMEYLTDRMSDDETLLVMPNGIKINYLLRKRNPTPYLMLTPWEMQVYGGEAAMRETIRQSAPDFIVVIQNDMREHGVNYFGEPGYGENIMDWIGRNYSLLRTVSSTDGAGGSGRIRFVVQIFQHKDADEKS